MALPEHTEELLRLMLAHDCHSELWWNTRTRTKDGDLQFFINCNDVFVWGCADLEAITEENLPVLKESLAISSLWGSLLFCARVRGMRPQGAMYAHIDKELWEHFDACGPEREIDLGNPITQDGEYAYSRSEDS